MNPPESASPRRPLAGFQPCPACLAELERQRAAVGEQGVAVAYCGHESGVFAIWSAGDLVLKPCATIAEAQRIEAGVTAMLARLQLLAETMRDGASSH